MYQNKQQLVNIVRNGMDMGVAFRDLKAGDIACLPSGEKVYIGEDAHICGDSDYEGWVVYDEQSNGYFPEDFEPRKAESVEEENPFKRNILVGGDYIFFFRFNDGDSAGLLKYNGRKCKVSWKEDEAHYQGDASWENVEQRGGLFDVCFPTGDEFCVYGEELEPIQRCKEVKDGFYCVANDALPGISIAMLMTMLPKSPEESQHGFWSNGQEILCKQETAIGVVSDFLMDLGLPVPRKGT